MNIADCNNHVKSVSEFFGDSCAVGALTTQYNPLGEGDFRGLQLYLSMLLAVAPFAIAIFICFTIEKSCQYKKINQFLLSVFNIQGVRKVR